MMHPNHDVNNVLITLINEGTLYHNHCSMGRAQIALPYWRQHIRANYRFHTTVLTNKQCNTAAIMLRDYYIAHVLEG